jgi:hypothetical protein
MALLQKLRGILSTSLTRAVPMALSGFNVTLLTTVVGATLGALCAGGTLAIARRPVLPAPAPRPALER